MLDFAGQSLPPKAVAGETPSQYGVGPSLTEGRELVLGVGVHNKKLEHFRQPQYFLSAPMEIN